VQKNLTIPKTADKWVYRKSCSIRSNRRKKKQRQKTTSRCVF